MLVGPITVTFGYVAYKIATNEMVFCFGNYSGCFDKKLLQFLVKLRRRTDFAKSLRSLEQNMFLTFYQRFLKLYNMQQLNSPLEKAIGMQKITGTC